LPRAPPSQWAFTQLVVEELAAETGSGKRDGIGDKCKGSSAYGSMFD
jgi:hypothetical protein